MILLSIILLLPNFCQRAFLGKLCSQLGLENRQLVEGKNALAYNTSFLMKLHLEELQFSGSY